MDRPEGETCICVYIRVIHSSVCTGRTCIHPWPYWLEGRGGRGHLLVLSPLLLKVGSGFGSRAKGRLETRGGQRQSRLVSYFQNLDAFLTPVYTFLRTVSSDAARRLGASIHTFLGKLSTGAQRAIAFAVIDEAPQSNSKVYSHMLTISSGICE